LKQEFPKFKSKLYAVAGDIGQPQLGISEQDQALLAREIDIVFHVAATVRFDEAIKTAIQMNVRGTREILNMCQNFPRLKVR
jgi:fatty acyl-CoA reductase